MSTTFYYVVVNYKCGKNPLFMSNANSKKIGITSDYITLGQLLKFARIISYGGEEKSYLASHRVLVNGLEDNRRGRKLYPGDKVLLEDGEFEITK